MFREEFFVTRLIRAAAIACLTAGLSAQDLPSRVGLSVYVLQPSSDLSNVASGGFAVSLPIYFNRDGQNEGRLRIDYLTFSSKTFTNNDPYFGPVSATLDTKGIGVGYDWMPRVAGTPNGASFNFILGLGGIFWSTDYKDAYYGSTTDASFAISPTVGVAGRFNANVGAELRYTFSKVTASTNSNLEDQNANFLSAGLNFRF